MKRINRMELRESDDALPVLRALKMSAILVEADGEVVGSLGCRPPFGMLADHPKLAELMPFVAASSKTGETFDLDLEVPTPPDFTRSQVSRVRVATLGDGRVAICFDEPQPLRNEPLATGQLREYEFVVRNIRQGIWRLDSQGTILYVNPFLAAWLESTPERLIGRNITEFLPNSEVAQRATGTERFESEFVTESGLVRRSIVVTSPLVDTKGTVTGRVELVTDITAEHAVQARLVLEVQRMAQLASLDPLTNLLNRRAFELTLNDMLEHAGNHPFGLIILDLDGLKQINDEFGHEAGDHAIVQFSRRLAVSVRDGDRVARIGGDEFAVLVPDVNLETLSEISQRLSEAMRFEDRFGDANFSIQASVGCSHSSQSREKMLAMADRAMYREKRGKRAR